MTKKQKIFADEYLIDLNATRAYRVAYPSVKRDETARANGSRMLTNANVAKYISERMQERQQRTEVTQDMVVKELAAIAFARATDYVEIRNNGVYSIVVIKPTADLSDQQIRAIAGIKEGANGIEIKLNDKEKALELLGRHLGMWNEPYKIGHWVGFKDLTALHNEWLRSFLYAERDQTLLAHRGSYKTTDLSLFLAIHTVIDPNENVMFFRKTDDDVTEVLVQTQKILKAGCMQQIVRTLYGTDLQFLKENNSEIHTNLCTSTKGVSQVVGLGIGTSITGKHADIVVTDDIVNLKDRISKAERERTKTQYMELQNICNRGGRFINTGTPWHKEDAISIMPNVRKYDCYSTGLITRDKLERLRQSMSDSLFAANYELKHIADKDAMFQNPQFAKDSQLIYGGMAHIDAAYDGEDGTAYTIMKKLSDGQIIGFGKRWDKHVDDCLSEIGIYHKRFRAGSISCEKNADKGYLAKELRGLGYHVDPYSESMNKFLKISTHLRSNWKNIVWLEDTDSEYINEILDYSEFAEHDDSPDSAASLLRKYDKKSHYNGGLTGGI